MSPRGWSQSGRECPRREKPLEGDSNPIVPRMDPEMGGERSVEISQSGADESLTVGDDNLLWACMKQEPAGGQLLKLNPVWP